MELASAVFVIFLTAVVFATVALPLMVISRVMRLLKSSYTKLFAARTKRA